MEIVDPNAAYLSNYEVMSHIKLIKSRINEDHRDKRRAGQEQLATITYETIHYLESTVCAKQEPEQIAKFVQGLTDLKLTKKEKLIMTNTPPTTALDIQLMVEDSEERLTEADVEKILKHTLDCFPFLKKPEEEEAESDENM